MPIHHGRRLFFYRNDRWRINGDIAVLPRLGQIMMAEEVKVQFLIDEIIIGNL